MNIDEIENRLKAATPGPWVSIKNEVRTTVPSKRDPNWCDWICKCQVIPLAHESNLTNAEFIAHAPTDIERLIKAHRIMREALEAHKIIWARWHQNEKHECMVECKIICEALAEVDKL